MELEFLSYYEFTFCTLHKDNLSSYSISVYDNGSSKLQQDHQISCGDQFSLFNLRIIDLLSILIVVKFTELTYSLFVFY